MFLRRYTATATATAAFARKNAINTPRLPLRRHQLFHTHPRRPSLPRNPTTSTLTQPRRQPISSVQHALSFLPAALVPPVVFVGLALALWAYKCAMMVIFQNKIIYMPSMPPFSRSEKIEDYRALCRPVEWEEKRIRAGDGTEIAVCVGDIQSEKSATAVQGEGGKRKRVVVLYFQGNGSSTPPRLPLLSSVLKKLDSQDSTAHYTMVALAYRGYWTSRGRPSQTGIELDAIAALNWAQETYLASNYEEPTSFVLWGQSIGAGVATGLVAHHSSDIKAKTAIDGLILETPFLSIKSMLLAMYPQRWLPYRYLWPFLRNWWDSEEALRRIGRGLGRPSSLPVLIVSAANDELVPAGQAASLEQLCRDVGLVDVTGREVSGALHNDATVRGEGQEAVINLLKRVGESN